MTKRERIAANNGVGIVSNWTKKQLSLMVGSAHYCRKYNYYWSHNIGQQMQEFRKQEPCCKELQQTQRKYENSANWRISMRRESTKWRPNNDKVSEIQRVWANTLVWSTNKWSDVLNTASKMQQRMKQHRYRCLYKAQEETKIKLFASKWRASDTVMYAIILLKTSD